jgi:hypothetical protein
VAERPWKDASVSAIVAELAVTGPGPTLNGWLMLVGDKLAAAAEVVALDDAHDSEAADNAIALAQLWTFLRGTDDG